MPIALQPLITPAEIVRTKSAGMRTLAGMSIAQATRQLYSSPKSLCKKDSAQVLTCLYLYLYAADYDPGDGNYQTASEFLAVIGKIQGLQQECCDYIVDPVAGTNTNPGPIGPPVDPPPVLTTYGYRFGSSELDTTRDTPPLSAFVGSVEASIDATTLRNLPGVGITAALLTPGDRIWFIIVDASEAPFTKWSEKDNPFQQNLDIDPDFSTGVSVFFRYTDPATHKNYYITRFQTSFAGQVILSR